MRPPVPPPLVLRRVRLVPVRTAAPDGVVDVRVEDGVVTAVAPSIAPRPADHVVEADGRWAAPGLWDAHVHLEQWALSRRRLDVGGTCGPDEVVRRVAEHVRTLPDPTSVVLGYGHRSAAWSRPPTVTELDAVSGDHPVALVSGDAHNGWLNSAALRLLGVPPRAGALVEDEWFAVLARLADLPVVEDRAGARREALHDAVSRGVVGLVDMEFGAGPQTWADDPDALLRVRVATYRETLDAVVGAGLRTGDPLPVGDGLLTMGPLKVIFDGSVNTATACCHDPYPSPGGGPATTGTLNLPPGELVELLRRAGRAGLQVAVHAIGDAAVEHALDAIGAAGACGSIEHAQLVAPADLPRFAALGVTASVQPAHLLDDRDVTATLWPDRQDRCFPLRSLLAAGATLALGSDAPVAPLDPWLAMAAAVHRSGDSRPPWNPVEQLTAAEALAASTDGRTTLAPGAPADLVLLDADPHAPPVDGGSAAVAAHLRAVGVAATFVRGRAVHLAL